MISEWQTTMTAAAAETKDMQYFMVVRLYARETNRTEDEVKTLMAGHSAKSKKAQLVIKLARHRYYNGDYYDE